MTGGNLIVELRLIYSVITHSLYIRRMWRIRKSVNKNVSRFILVFPGIVLFRFL